MMNWKDKLRYGMSRMLYGRYGMDELGRFLWAAVIVLLIINLFVPNLILTALTLIVLIWMYARFFSKHYDRRRGSYRYYDCPGCHQRLRVPKGKGQITVTCPKCHTKFDAKS